MVEQEAALAGEQAAQFGIRVGDHAVGMPQDEDAVRRGLEQPPVAHLGGFETLAREMCLREVARDALQLAKLSLPGKIARSVRRNHAMPPPGASTR